MASEHEESQALLENHKSEQVHGILSYHTSDEPETTDPEVPFRAEPLLSNYTIMKRLLLIALPFAFNRGIGTLTDNIGRLLLGHKGASYLAGAGVYASTYTLTVVSAGVSVYGMSPLVGAAIRNEQPKQVGIVLNTTLLYAACLGSLVSGALAFSGELLELMGQPQEVAHIAQDIFRGAALGIPMTVLSVACQQTCYMLERVGVATTINLMRRVIYLGIAYLFINGNLGLPDLGAYGLGLADSVASTIDVILFLIYFKLSQFGENYGLLRTNFQDIISNIIPLLRQTTFSAAQNINVFITNFINTLFAGFLGVDQLAAWEINNQYNALVSMMTISFGQAVFIMISKIKESEKRLLTRIESMGALAASSIPLIFSPLLASIPRQLIQPFVSHAYSFAQGQSITDKATQLLQVSAQATPFTAYGAVLLGGIRARGYLKTPLALGVATYSGLGISTSAVMSFVYDYDTVGLGIGFLVGAVSLMLALFIFRLMFMKSEHRSAVTAPQVMTSTMMPDEIIEEHDIQASCTRRIISFFSGSTVKNTESRLRTINALDL